jgi:PHD/YefM family antitoxin component YafN of YafNO toxin-antitoxin module
MTVASVAELQEHLNERIDDVRFEGERIFVREQHQLVAALVSVDDVRLLEAMEDLADMAAACEALAEYEREHTSTSLNDFRAELGL